MVGMKGVVGGSEGRRGEWGEVIVVELIEMHKQFSRIAVQIPVDLL